MNDHASPSVERPTRASSGFSLRQAFNVTNLVALLVASVFGLIVLGLMIQAKRSELSLRLANEVEVVRREIDDVFAAAEYTARSQAQAFTLAARLPAADFEPWAERYSRASLQAETPHFDVYYGFTEATARRMFGTPGMVYVVTKDPARLGTPAFDDPATFRRLKYPDPAYLKDPSADWYHGAIENGGVHFTKLWYDAVYLKRVMISITMAARDPHTGLALGVAGVDITAGTFSSVLDRFHIGRTGGILLLDEKGRPQTIFAGRDIPMLGYRHDPTQDFAERFQESAPGIPDLSTTPGMHEISGEDGRKYLYQARRLVKRPYYVLAYQGRGEAFAPVYWTTATMIALALLFLAVSLLLRQKLTNLVVGNMERLLRNIDDNREAFAPGSADAKLERIKPQGPLELAILGDRLNQLYDRLESGFEEVRGERERAELATKAKSRFLSVMSHEIRTPLNSLLGLADVLLLTPLSSDQVRYVRVFQRSGQSLLRILNDLLDFSRLEAGKLRIERAEFDLFELIHDVDSLMRFDAESKGLRFVVTAPSSDYRLVGDTVRIRQVLLNLLGNAIKFTAKGSVELRVTAIREDGAPNQRRFQFEVTDTGIGMSPEARDRLFSEFSQADASITRRYGGTGLGLSISRQIVELLGGRLEVQSEEGKGSTFQFTLPLEVQGESKRRYEDTLPELQQSLAARDQARDRGLKPDTRVRPADARASTPEKPKTGNERAILVVDDDEDNHRLIDAYLRFRSDLRAEHAYSARDAIERLQRGEYALILMDMQMPDMDGLEATREIRRLQKLGTLPSCSVVMISANTFPEDRGRALQAGADDHVPKPFKLDRFNELLRAWVR
jgi:signal transduction histidine kinase/CheY-like chemotaxis protein